MIYSMTGYATATRDLPPVSPPAPPGQAVDLVGPGTGVSVELRTVNSRFLDLQFRMPDEVRGCEPALRELLMGKLSRGKVEVRVNVQRAEAIASGALDATALARLAALEDAARAAFPDAQRLGVADVLRWPGVIGDSSIDGDVLRDAVIDCAQDALRALVDVRGREGSALAAMLRERVVAMEAVVADITPLVPELIARQQQKIVERLQAAFDVSEGEAPRASAATALPREELAERIRQEVTMYGVRIDIGEELMRLSTHLAETRHILDTGGKVGKRLDFMMQELNREANTVGSKAAAKELADAAMTLKLLIEQMREQVQNLE